jgi:hypothetical protein
MAAIQQLKLFWGECGVRGIGSEALKASIERCRISVRKYNVGK